MGQQPRPPRRPLEAMAPAPPGYISVTAPLAADEIEAGKPAGYDHQSQYGAQVSNSKKE
jgi:hypothetical protein